MLAGCFTRKGDSQLSFRQSVSRDALQYNQIHKYNGVVYLVVTRRLEQDGHYAVPRTAYNNNNSSYDFCQRKILYAPIAFVHFDSVLLCPSFLSSLLRVSNKQAFLFLHVKGTCCTYVHLVTATRILGDHLTYYSQYNRSINHSLTHARHDD